MAPEEGAEPQVSPSAARETPSGLTPKAAGPLERRHTKGNGSSTCNRSGETAIWPPSFPCPDRRPAGMERLLPASRALSHYPEGNPGIGAPPHHRPMPRAADGGKKELVPRTAEEPGPKKPRLDGSGHAARRPQRQKQPAKIRRRELAHGNRPRAQSGGSKGIDDAKAVLQHHAILHILGIQYVAIGQQS